MTNAERDALIRKGSRASRQWERFEPWLWVWVGIHAAVLIALLTVYALGAR